MEAAQLEVQRQWEAQMERVRRHQERETEAAAATARAKAEARAAVTAELEAAGVVTASSAVAPHAAHRHHHHDHQHHHHAERQQHAYEYGSPMDFALRQDRNGGAAATGGRESTAAGSAAGMGRREHSSSALPLGSFASPFAAQVAHQHAGGASFGASHTSGGGATALASHSSAAQRYIVAFRDLPEPPRDPAALFAQAFASPASLASRLTASTEASRPGASYGLQSSPQALPHAGHSESGGILSAQAAASRALIETLSSRVEAAERERQAALSALNLARTATTGGPSTGTGAVTVQSVPGFSLQAHAAPGTAGVAASSYAPAGAAASHGAVSGPAAVRDAFAFDAYTRAPTPSYASMGYAAGAVASAAPAGHAAAHGAAAPAQSPSSAASSYSEWHGSAPQHHAPAAMGMGEGAGYGYAYGSGAAAVPQQYHHGHAAAHWPAQAHAHAHGGPAGTTSGSARAQLEHFLRAAVASGAPPDAGVLASMLPPDLVAQLSSRAAAEDRARQAAEAAKAAEAAAVAAAAAQAQAAAAQVQSHTPQQQHRSGSPGRLALSPLAGAHPTTLMASVQHGRLTPATSTPGAAAGGGGAASGGGHSPVSTFSAYLRARTAGAAGFTEMQSQPPPQMQHASGMSEAVSALPAAAGKAIVHEQAAVAEPVALARPAVSGSPLLSSGSYDGAGLQRAASARQLAASVALPAAAEVSIQSPQSRSRAGTSSSAHYDDHGDLSAAHLHRDHAAALRAPVVAHMPTTSSAQAVSAEAVSSGFAHAHAMMPAAAGHSGSPGHAGRADSPDAAVLTARLEKLLSRVPAGSPAAASLVAALAAVRAVTTR